MHEFLLECLRKSLEIFPREAFFSLFLNRFIWESEERIFTIIYDIVCFLSLSPVSGVTRIYENVFFLKLNLSQIRFDCKLKLNWRRKSNSPESVQWKATKNWLKITPNGRAPLISSMDCQKPAGKILLNSSQLTQIYCQWDTTVAANVYWLAFNGQSDFTHAKVLQKHAKWKKSNKKNSR